MSIGGYCHFNEGGAGKGRYFSINVFGYDLMILQDPESRILGHGAVVWDAAVVFVKYMEKNSKDFDPVKLSQKRVLELGSGCGLAGIAYMLRGAAVTLTDLPNVVLTLTERNAQTIYSQVSTLLLNDAAAYGSLSIQKPKVHSIDWTEAASRSVHLNESSENGISFQMDNLVNHEDKYDVVLLTDCVFSASLVNDLVKTILNHVEEKATVICCHEIRDEEANAAFLLEFSNYFEWKRIPKSKLDVEYSNDLIEIIVGKLKKKSKKSHCISSTIVN
mmetsp:Transcript_13173/g.19799  ORF Transcript_13173/g.19799 Transcript_13173/m.19799 type:complete len:275 (-) Transcript_13173:16-840(-)